MKVLKNYFPVFILALCCVLYSWNFYERLIFVHGDEGFYSMGYFEGAGDWGPLYMLHYYLLNLLTNDSFISLYINHFILTFAAIPWVTYLTLRLLKFNITSSSLAALIALLSTWNYPSETRVHIFNYVVILIAFILRWDSVKNISFKNTSFNLGKLFFYVILGMSLYIRQDNIIIAIVAFVWDFFHSKQKKHLLIFALISISIYFLLKIFFGNAYSHGRSVEIFMDHFLVNNRELFTQYADSKMSGREILAVYFNKPTTLWQIFLSHPKEVIAHFIKNALLFFKNMYELSSLSLDSQWTAPTFLKVFFVFAIIKIFSNDLNSPDSKINFKELVLLTLAFTIKCVGISILLNWWLKYYFELQIILMAWIIVILSLLKKHRTQIKDQIIASCNDLTDLLNRIISKHSRKEASFLPVNSIFNFLKNNFIWIILPFLFFYYDYENRTPRQEKEYYKIVEFFKLENSIDPIMVAISGNQLYLTPAIEHKQIDPWYHIELHPQIKSDFKKFLDDNRIDTVFMYNVLRTILMDNGIAEPFEKFEEAPEDYGFQRRYVNFNNQIVYRRIEKLPPILDNKNVVK